LPLDQYKIRGQQSVRFRKFLVSGYSNDFDDIFNPYPIIARSKAEAISVIKRIFEEPEDIEVKEVREFPKSVRRDFILDVRSPTSISREARRVRRIAENPDSYDDY
jgi:hypothetical protein